MEIGTLEISSGNNFSQANVDIMNAELAAGRWVVAKVNNATGSYHSIVIKNFDQSSGEYTYWNPWTDGGGRFTTTQLQTNSIMLDSNSTLRRIYEFNYCRQERSRS